MNTELFWDGYVSKGFISDGSVDRQISLFPETAHEITYRRPSDDTRSSYDPIVRDATSRTNDIDTQYFTGSCFTVKRNSLLQVETQRQHSTVPSKRPIILLIYFTRNRVGFSYLCPFSVRSLRVFSYILPFQRTTSYFCLLTIQIRRKV